MKGRHPAMKTAIPLPFKNPWAYKPPPSPTMIPKRITNNNPLNKNLTTTMGNKVYFCRSMYSPPKKPSFH